MEKLAITIITLGALVLTGCSTTTQPVSGAIYSNVRGPVDATPNVRGPSKGETCATSYLGLIALGDASISAASDAGGILKISYVDQHSTNILGIVNTYCTIVWGFKTASD